MVFWGYGLRFNLVILNSKFKLLVESLKWHTIALDILMQFMPLVHGELYTILIFFSLGWCKVTSCWYLNPKEFFKDFRFSSGAICLPFSFFRFAEILSHYPGRSIVVVSLDAPENLPIDFGSPERVGENFAHALHLVAELEVVRVVDGQFFVELRQEIHFPVAKMCKNYVSYYHSFSFKFWVQSSGL